MSRLTIKADIDKVLDGIYKDTERKIIGNQPGLCPVDLTLTYLRISHAQSCGKCVPCRVGLGQLANLLEQVLDGKATMRTLDIIKETAQAIVDSADCAIGQEGARLVLKALAGFHDDFVEHIESRHCISRHQFPVPCVALCPANVDVPGYIALISEGRPDDAVALIRKDNPMPAACAYVCEHPCELRCRRQLIDAPLNIRGLKRFAVDNAGDVPNPPCAPATGRKVAIVGGGPSGLTAAYFLTLMGHKTVIYEKRQQLGGMLRYGIPAYRLPREVLDKEIESILSVGIEAHTDVNIGEDITFEKLNAEFDAVYIAIGAQSDRKVGIEGEDAEGVMSAVELLRGIGDGNHPDFTGKKVAIIGGGNVAMDACRTSVRLGAERVYCVYRRRIEDMTALPEEVTGAMEEGVEMKTLYAPVRVEKDEEGRVAGLAIQPQLSGEYDRGGRPRPTKASLPEEVLDVDIVIAAVGQAVDSETFANAGMSVKWGNIVAGKDGSVKEYRKVFSGGDCVSGPATAIKAIAAGKVAAGNIDEFLGFHHPISVDIDIPAPKLKNRTPRGRINITGRDSEERAGDFKDIECGLTCEGASIESDRCLRCDYFGYGVFRGGREKKW